MNIVLRCLRDFESAWFFLLVFFRARRCVIYEGCKKGEGGWVVNNLKTCMQDVSTTGWQREEGEKRIRCDRTDLWTRASMARYIQRQYNDVDLILRFFLAFYVFHERSRIV